MLVVSPRPACGRGNPQHEDDVDDRTLVVLRIVVGAIVQANVNDEDGRRKNWLTKKNNNSTTGELVSTTASLLLLVVVVRIANCGDVVLLLDLWCTILENFNTMFLFEQRWLSVARLWHYNCK